MAGNRSYSDSFPIPKALTLPESPYESLAAAISLVNAYFDAEHGGIRIAQQVWSFDIQTPGSYYSNVAWTRSTSYIHLIHPAVWTLPPSWKAINAVFVVEVQDDSTIDVRLTATDVDTPANSDANETSTLIHTAIQRPEEIVELSGFRKNVYAVPATVELVNVTGATTLQIEVETRAFSTPRTSTNMAPWRPLYLDVFASRELIHGG